MLRYTIDRARPDLVALYDIRPGNGVGLFLQPQSPHGAQGCWGAGAYCGGLPHSLFVTDKTYCNHLFFPLFLQVYSLK